MKRHPFWDYVPFCEGVEICDSFRKPVNSEERKARIANKSASDLFPYFGATGQVGFIDDYLINGQYVLLGEDGAPFLDPFAPKAYLISGKAWVNNHAHILCSKTNNKFLLHYLNYYDYKGFVSGTTRLKLTQAQMKRIPIPAPPISEQERIVARIEEMFSELDAGVETLKKTKAQLAVYRQAVLKEAFERAGGEQEPIKNLCFFITKGTTPSKNELHSKSGDVPFIKVYNLTFDNTLDFTIDPTFVDKDTHLSFLSRSIVYPGDVLMNIVGPPMGKVSIVPNTYPEWNINQAIARFRCLERINNKYLAYYLGYAGTVEKMKSKAKATAGQFNLTLEICRELTINLPCIEKQEQIIDEIEEKLSQCIKIEQTVNSALQQAEAMRQSILKDAFEGRL